MISRRRVLQAGGAFSALMGPGGTAFAQRPQAAERFADLVRQMSEAGIERQADIEYSSEAMADPSRRCLDIYSAAGFSAAPVVMFFHGGSWQVGDKRAIGQKPFALVPAGFLVVSANYRLRPEVTVSEMAADVARSVAWVIANIAEYGGDPGRVFLVGHSAGAHLVSLVGTNAAYLECFGLGLRSLSGVISLDTGPYNVASLIQRLAVLDTPYANMIRLVFGSDVASYGSVSPFQNIEAGRGIPPFLVVASDNRADVPLQAQPFVDRLKGAGVEASLYTAAGRTHETLSTLLGAADDPTTAVVLDFLNVDRR